MFARLLIQYGDGNCKKGYSGPPVCNSNATRWWSFVTPLAVKYKLKDRFQRFQRTAKFVGSSLGLKQGSPLTSVLNKFPELDACSPLGALSLFEDMPIWKRTLRIYKTLEITFLNGGKDLYPRRQCDISVRLSQLNVFFIPFTTQLNRASKKTTTVLTSHV